MDPRITNWIFGLITLGALSFAAFIYVSKTDERSPTVTTSMNPSGTPSVGASSAGTPSVSPSPSLSPSPSPTATASTTTRTFTVSQGLAVANQVETIQSGGSLSGIANEHGIRSTELAKLNGITDVNTIFAGQTLIVPDDVSGNTYTILYTTNTVRLAREKSKLAAGSTSIYSDPIMAAQTDLKGLYGLAADTPYSKTDTSETVVTLSASSDDKIVTVTVEKDASGLWIVKKVILKITAQAT